MALIPVGFAQSNIRFAGVQYPNGAEVVMGHNVTVGGLTPQDVADLVRSNVQANLMDQMSQNTTFIGVLVKFGPVATGPSAFSAANTPGTLPGEGAAPNTSYLIRKNTAFGGRAGRGRMYLPGVTEPDCLLGGVLDTPRRDALELAMEDFRAQLATDAIPAELLHSVGSPLSTPSSITSFAVDARVATQRRRLRG